MLCRSTNRSGGDARIKLSKPLPEAPHSFTGLKAHKLASLDGERPVTVNVLYNDALLTDNLGITT